MAGHVAPEAANGGPIAAINDATLFLSTFPSATLSVKLTDAEIQRRLSTWKPPQRASPAAVMAKYALSSPLPRWEPLPLCQNHFQPLRKRLEDIMKLTGREILCESLTKLECAIFLVIRRRHSSGVRRLGKSKLHHILVRHEQGATHMADGYGEPAAASVWPWPLPGRARPTWSPASPPPCWIPRPWSASPARSAAKLLGSDAFQESTSPASPWPITKHNVVVSRAEDIAAHRS